MFLVKREVMATSIKNALTSRGLIYEVVEVAEDKQPVVSRPVGFKSKRKR